MDWEITDTHTLPHYCYGRTDGLAPGITKSYCEPRLGSATVPPPPSCPDSRRITQDDTSSDKLRTMAAGRCQTLNLVVRFRQIYAWHGPLSFDGLFSCRVWWITSSSLTCCVTAGVQRIACCRTWCLITSALPDTNRYVWPTHGACLHLDWNSFLAYISPKTV